MGYSVVHHLYEGLVELRVYLLNSSKLHRLQISHLSVFSAAEVINKMVYHDQAPVCANPENILPMLL